MRSKHRAALAVGVVGLFCLATACDDDDGGTAPSGNQAGESGAGAGGGDGSGGKSSAGSGGTMSRGGEPMGDAGQPSGQAGEGGRPSANGGESPGGSGGDAAGAGGANDSGPGGCTPITLAPFDQAEVTLSYAVYVTSFTPNVGAAAADDFSLAIQGPPYDGDRTGTFDLTQNGDDNYKTCARCLLVYADDDQKIFYPTEGTLEIAADSKQLGGSIDATITNLKLVEVTIGGDFTSTPVPDGACLTVASATIQVTAPACGGFECNNGYCLGNASWECDEAADCPDESDEFPVNPSCDPVWLCPPTFKGDGSCDCGCGIQDVDCAGTMNASECDYCSRCQGNLDACNDGEVDPVNTTQCL